jgi:plasmid stabilization system protein ParE
MNFTVRMSRQAEGDVDRIVASLVQRSPEGAARWLAALDAARVKLCESPLGYPLAPESDFVGAEIRQNIFKTPRGRRYRALFVVVDNEVRILHVRGPNQALLRPSDFE